MMAAWTWVVLKAKSVWVRIVRAGTWMAFNVRVISGAVLQTVEVGAMVGVATWAAIGAYHYGCDTHWSLNGLLTLLDERWKGTLILAGFLLYRTLQEVIARTKKFRVPWGELPESVDPAGEAQEVRRVERVE